MSHGASRPFERTGETHGLDQWGLDLRSADSDAVDHVEHTLGHVGLIGGTNYCSGYLLTGCHVSAVRL